MAASHLILLQSNSVHHLKTIKCEGSLPSPPQGRGALLDLLTALVNLLFSLTVLSSCPASRFKCRVLSFLPSTKLRVSGACLRACLVRWCGPWTVASTRLFTTTGYGVLRCASPTCLLTRFSRSLLLSKCTSAPFPSIISDSFFLCCK